MIEQIERSIFFRFTRIFAWIIILPAFIAFAASTVFFVKNYIKTNSSATVEVRYDEVKQLMDKKEQMHEGQKSESGEIMKDKLDPKTEAIINDINAELKVALRSFGEKKIEEMMREHPYWDKNYLTEQFKQRMDAINNETKTKLAERAMSFKQLSERHQFFGGLLDIIKKTEIEKKMSAFDIYEKLWREKKESKEAEIAQSRQQQTMLMTVIGSSFAVIALFSLLLVLLSIERNTRTVKTKPSVVTQTEKA